MPVVEYNKEQLHNNLEMFKVVFSVARFRWTGAY